MNTRNHLAKLLAVSLLTICGVSSVGSKAPSPIIVNSNADTATGDTDLTDGYCGTSSTVTPPAGGAPVVTQTPNTCTLRAAIQNANLDAATDTILFASSLAPSQGAQQTTLTLSSALPAITSPVVIDAAAANPVTGGPATGLPAGFTIDGNDQLPVLRFVDGNNEAAPSGAAVTAGDSVLTRLSLTNGLTNSANGGGAIFFGAPVAGGVPSKLTLNFVNVTSSASTTAVGQNPTPAGPGGAISISDGNALIAKGGMDGTPSVFRGNITGNTAPRGGGISVVSLLKGPAGVSDNNLGDSSDDVLTLSNLVLRNNAATVDHGGAIYANLDNGGDVKITAVDIGGTTAAAPPNTPADANTAAGDGGGIWLRATASTSDLLIDGSSIRNNKAVNGAGVTVKLGTLQISNSTLSANAASGSGGGVWLDTQLDNVSGGSLRTSNVTFSGNSAAAAGGGIGAKAANPTASSLLHTTLADNTAAAAMGGGLSGTAAQFPGTFSAPFTSNIFSNSTGGNCRAPLSHTDNTNAGFEVATDTSCGFTQASDQQSVDARLGGLANKNSPVTRTFPLTRPLLSGSPALDLANPNWATLKDERGADRQDGGADNDPTNGPARRDIGAYEFGGYGLVEFFNASSTMAAFSVDENNGSGAVIIRRVGTGTAAVDSSIDVVDTLSGSATGTADGTGDTADYTLLENNRARVNLTGAGNVTSTLPISITNDRRVEGDETINLSLATNATHSFVDIGSRNPATLTIKDVENGTFQFAPLSYTVSEGVGMAALTITRSNGVAGRARVTFSTSDVTDCTPAATCSAKAGSDYTAQDATQVIFEDGATSATALIPITDDGTNEAAEQFKATLTAVACVDANNNTIGSTRCDAMLNTANNNANLTATVSIMDNDGALALSIGDASITEKDSASETQTLSFPVMLNKPSSSTVTVRYATSNGPGGQAAGAASCPSPTSPNSDYIAKAAADNLLTFPPNTTTQTATVTVCSDTVFEGNETFFVDLSGETNAGVDKRQGVGTIVENEAAPTQGSIGLDNAVQTVVEATPTNKANFVVRRTGNNGTSGTVTVNFAVTNPGYSSFTNNGACTTDAAGPDYRLSSTNTATGTTGTVVVVNNDGTGTITYNGSSNADATLVVEVCNDTRRESDQIVTLKLGTPSNGAVAGTSTGKLTIQSDEKARVQLTPASQRLREGDDAAAKFVVQLIDAPLDGERICVPYKTNDVTAKAGMDYVAITGPADACTGTLVWNTGDSDSKTLSSMIIDDGDTPMEGEETFTLDLGSASSGGTVTTAQSTVTIINLPRIYFNPKTYTSSGEKGTIVFEVMRSSGTGASSAEYQITSGSGERPATLGTDFTTTPSNGVGTVSFAEGETGPKLVTVTVTQDQIIEGDESFDVRLRNPTNATLSASTDTPVFVNGTIQDDDFRFEFSSASTSVNEDGGNAVLTVKRVGHSLQDSTVDFTVTAGTATAGADYTAPGTTTLTFTAGTDGTQTITVPVIDDTTDEVDETFTVALANPSAPGQLGSPTSSTVTIVDNDDAPTLKLSPANPSVTEGDMGAKTLTFTATLSAASEKAVMVTASTADGTATAGSDYASTTQMLMFPAGTTVRTFDVTINGDTLSEPDENFTVSLSNPSNATFATAEDARATVNIANDDPVPSVAINDVTVTEGNSGSTNAIFTVSLSAASGQTVAVRYATTDGTATSGSDYQSTAGTLSFAPGETSKTVVVAVVGDTANETDETFFVNLVAAENAGIADASGTGTITNDDAVPTLSIADSSVTEGSNGALTMMRFTVSLSAASGQSVTVSYATADGSAIAGQDYTSTSDTLTIPAGQTSASFTVPVTADNSDEQDESFTVTLGNAVNASISTARATGTILDDDTAPASASSVDGQGRSVGFSTSAGGFEGLNSTAQPANAPTTLVYDNGFFTYTIAGLADGASATVTVTLPAGSSATTYVDCPSDCITSGSGSGQTVTVTLVDGGPGDADGVANGRIVVKAGAGGRAPTVTPPPRDDGNNGGGNGGGGGGGGGSFGSLTLLGLATLFGLRRRRS